MGKQRIRFEDGQTAKPFEALRDILTKLVLNPRSHKPSATRARDVPAW